MTGNLRGGIPQGFAFFEGFDLPDLGVAGSGVGRVAPKRDAVITCTARGRPTARAAPQEGETMLDRRTTRWAGAALAALVAACGGNTSTSSGTSSTTTGATTTTTSSGGATCADVCPAVVAAACSKGPPSAAECETGCASAMSKCGAAIDALFACAGAAPKFVCDGAGNPYPKGCEAQNTALNACTNGTPQACTEMCPAVVAAGCNAGPPDVKSCESGCAAETGKCPTEFAALMQCAGASPTFVCGANGTPTPDGCTGQGDALGACIAK